MHSDLVYALEPLINGGNLSFLPRQYAQERAQEMEALLGVTTWGQAKALTLIHLGDRFEDEIDDDEPYTLREDPALADGDFPAMVSQWALNNLLFPPEVFVRIGTVKHTVFNGPFLAINPDREAEVVTTLREAGYHVERDDRLVLSCGGTCPRTCRRRSSRSRTSPRSASAAPMRLRPDPHSPGVWGDAVHDTSRECWCGWSTSLADGGAPGYLPFQPNARVDVVFREPTGLWCPPLSLVSPGCPPVSRGIEVFSVKAPPWPLRAQVPRSAVRGALAVAHLVGRGEDP